MESNIEHLRQSYSKASLSKSDLDPNPFAQFDKWFKEAQESNVIEPNAMSLATADGFGRPSNRIVLLKSYDNQGFIFYTNYTSKKAKDLAYNRYVSANFFWKELERQIRIDGVVRKISKEKSEAYFQSRPRNSQIGAWVSAQSKIIKSRKLLEDQQLLIEQKFRGQDVLPIPEFWGGYIIVPSSFEFWQGRTSRLHDRLRYKHYKGLWHIDRLSP